jgi:predicted Rossmann-fold nucleotide-binding protein
VRKITIFGSARLAPDTPAYQMALQFSRAVSALGFMIMTGGGGGIMQAGQEGAGRENSFGLNIQLPLSKKLITLSKVMLNLLILNTSSLASYFS